MLSSKSHFSKQMIWYQALKWGILAILFDYFGDVLTSV